MRVRRDMNIRQLRQSGESVEGCEDQTVKIVW